MFRWRIGDKLVRRIIGSSFPKISDDSSEFHEFIELLLKLALFWPILVYIPGLLDTDRFEMVQSYNISNADFSSPQESLQALGDHNRSKSQKSNLAN